MSKVKKITAIVLFLIIVIAELTTVSLAEYVTVTDENLNEAFQNFTESESNEDNYTISMENNTIIVEKDGETFTLNYDLTDKPTFTYEVSIETGMSYEEFETQTDNLTLPRLGYLAVTNIQGIEFEDSSMYFILTYCESILKGAYTSESTYVIVDDLNLEDGVTIEKTDDTNTIYTSEFGERVMEYVNALYAETQTVEDSEYIDSYEMSIEKQDIDEESCKLVATLSVNTDADFSQIEEYVKRLEDSVTPDITEEEADYAITLKVGQKCKFESNEEIIGYELYGGYVEISEDKSEITAVEAGTTVAYLYVGDANTRKSIYITIEENESDEELDAITLKLDETVKEESNDDNEEDGTVTPEPELPNAGVHNVVFAVIIAFVIFVIVNGLKLRKYKDIE